MGRPRKPTKTKIITGTFRPCRANPDEPIPDLPLGEPPADFDEKQQAAWAELSKIVPEGILFNSDRIIVEISSRLLSELRENGKLTSGDLGHLISCLSRLGLSPSDRSKVSVKQKKSENPWSKF